MILNGLRKADWWHSENTHIRCDLCPHSCLLADGEAGFCRVRRNDGGMMASLVYGRASSIALDPIEKKPLYHWRPGTDILSIGTVGCSMACPFCQNWEIATWEKGTRLQDIDVSDVLRLARTNNTRAVAFTYNEPLVWYEFIADCAAVLREEGIAVVLVSNGMIREEPLLALLPFLSAANVDVKTFDSVTYRNLGGDIDSVKKTVERMFEANVHVEITTLVVPDISDDPDDFAREVEWIASISPDIPLHLSRYFPRHRWSRPATSETLLDAMATTARRLLRHVYLGNVNRPSDTICPKCGSTVVSRRGYSISRTGLNADGGCRNCGTYLCMTTDNSQDDAS